MITLCCTHKIRGRLNLSRVLSAPVEPTARLGNLYVHLVHFGHLQVVLATSERSLLTVVLPTRALRETLEHNLRAAVGQLLSALQVQPELVSREILEMQSVSFAGATNRRVIGSINEFAFHTGVHLDLIGDPLGLALRLSDIPMSAAGSKSHYGIPREVACELLSSAFGH